MGVLIEIVIQLVGEVLFEGVFEGIGWMTKRRWGRLLLGITIGVAGGLAWTALGHNGPPLVATVVVAAQALVIPIAAGRTVAGRLIERRVLVDAALVGLAVVAARWIGWAVL